MGNDCARPDAPADSTETVPLSRAVSDYAGRTPVRFHVPGHKGRAGGANVAVQVAVATEAAGAWVADAWASLLASDVTELPGLDDLAAPDGPILELERRLARLYGASRSLLLVGGSTLGLQAAIMATAQDGDVLVVPRDAHRCIVAGLILAGALPYYVLPRMDTRSGLTLGPTPEAYREALKTCSEQGRRAVAAVVTNPNYYGVCPDLAEVVRVCHEYGARCIVDEAHGAHFRFTPRAPVDGLGADADIVVQSPHKTLTSMTQSAWMHVRDRDVGGAWGTCLSAVVKSRLLLLQSSSPSYPLMCSLEASVVFLEGLSDAGLVGLVALADRARAEAAALGFRLHFAGERQDPARLLLGADAFGLSGEDFASALMGRGIYPELHAGAGCLLVLGPGTTEADIDALTEALDAIAEAVVATTPAGGTAPAAAELAAALSPTCIGPAGFSAISPRQAALAPSENVVLSAAVGRISAASIAPSPPSIALVLPGDAVTRQVVDALQASGGAKLRVHGAGDPSLRTISVVRHMHWEGGSSCRSRQ